MPRAPQVTVDTLCALLGAQPPQSAAVLGARLGVSQPSLSRLLARAGDRVVRIGRARATRYAASRAIARMGSRWPLYQIDENGHTHRLGVLHALVGQAWMIDFDRAAPALTWGEFNDGLYPDLPWFLADARPQGFLGRAFARGCANDLHVNPDPELWRADDVVLAMLRYGTDLIGDLVLGEQAAELALRAPENVVTQPRVQRYAQLAEQAMSGFPAGSSAGGEQPKFTTVRRLPDESLHPVLIKFSERVSNPVGRRWAELLALEHLAAELLLESGVAAVTGEWMEADGRCFLELSRFDRSVAGGRRGQLSLGALDDAHYGKRDRWDLAAARLQRDGWISAGAAQELRLLWCFGSLIGNSDMHFGNISLVCARERPWALCPVYDMLPMQYRPGPGGELRLPPLDPPPPLPENRDAWRRAAAMASIYWQRAAADIRLGSAMRARCADNQATVAAMVVRFGS